MSAIHEVSRRRTRAKALDGNDTRAMLLAVAREAIEPYLPELLANLRDQLTDELAKHLASVPHIKGDKGDTGPRGVSVTGPQGPQGPTGKDGKDGIGKDGKDGAPGKDGRDGKTPSLKEIKALFLPDLERWATEMARKIKGGGAKGGGGMGNVTHQHTAVSSATTQITTTYKIGGGGFALWAYYNGQLLARGTDYTVGADQKTLALLFTPQDSTIIDLVYIRS